MSDRLALLVLLNDLDIPTYNALFNAIKAMTGVNTVTNLSVVSRETLDLLLLPDDQKIRPAAKRVRKKRAAA